MSLTSYRAAPPRANIRTVSGPQTKKPPLGVPAAAFCNIANGFLGTHQSITLMGPFLLTPPAKPGDDLLFHRLSDSTIGAVRFHGRVRDGIGWVTDAMVTKLWGRRVGRI